MELGHTAEKLVPLLRNFNAQAPAFAAAAHQLEFPEQPARDPGMSESNVIEVPILTRVEGEGGVTVRLAGEVITDVQLRIYKPPRLLEALLVGRPLEETPDITARICGICPVAYQMSSVQALEKALGVKSPRKSAVCAGCSTVANGLRVTPCICICYMPRIFLTRQAVSNSLGSIRWKFNVGCN